MYYKDLVQEVILNIDGVFLLWSKKDVKFQFECTNDVVMSYMRIYIISCVKMTPVLLARNYFRLVFTHSHSAEEEWEGTLFSHQMAPPPRTQCRDHE